MIPVFIHTHTQYAQPNIYNKLNISLLNIIYDNLFADNSTENATHCVLFDIRRFGVNASRGHRVHAFQGGTYG